MNLSASDLFWQALAALIVVAGPWKAAIVFAERTVPLDRPARVRTAVLTVVIATIAGVVFIFVGEPLVELFHISEGAFLVGAGLIVVVFSIRLVIAEQDEEEGEREPTDSRRKALQLAVYPLSVPLVITPPAIATLIALGVLAQVSDESLVTVLAAFSIVMAVNLVVFLLESRFEQLLSPAVYQVGGRLFGVLLTAFGVGIVVNGLTELNILDL